MHYTERNIRSEEIHTDRKHTDKKHTKRKYTKWDYLISETTKRGTLEAMVAESAGNIEVPAMAACRGLAEMYQDYIDGKKELREINMEFNASGYVHGEDMPGQKRLWI